MKPNLESESGLKKLSVTRDPEELESGIYNTTRSLFELAHHEMVLNNTPDHFPVLVFKSSYPLINGKRSSYSIMSNWNTFYVINAKQTREK